MRGFARVLAVIFAVVAILVVNRPVSAADENPFPNRTPAPALVGGTEWLNTSAPVDLKDLRGKFVVLDFWTYCCINCMHVLPELKKLEKAYPNNIVVVGVHSGKFDTEHDSESIRQAVMRNEIEHPVVNDADMKIWNAFHCSSWPSLRVIDPEGNLVAMRNGEVDFETLDGFFKSKLDYYRKKGLLNEKPIKFDLEASKAKDTPLRYPGKILADEAGKRLFIADSNHNRIVVTDLEGNVITRIGWQLGRADGDFTTAEFNHPQGMALRGDTLYVADTENHLIRKVDLKTQKVRTIAGTGEQSKFPWPGLDPNATKDQVPERFSGAPLKTGLTSPWDLWIAGDNLYIAMAGAHAIWRMPLDESEIGPYAGNGREDIVDGPLLPKIPYDQDFSSFAQPSGLTSDGKSLFVADSEGSSVRSVPLAGGKVSTVLGTAELPVARLFTFGDVDGGPGKGKLQHCLGVAYHDGKIYIADTYNHKIKALDLKTRELKTIAGTDKPGHDDSPNKAGDPAASFFEPAGISYAAGKLFVADTNNHLIRVIDLANGNKVSTLKIAGLQPPPPGFGGPLRPSEITIH